MEKKYFVAFDLGATSGRTILGTLEGEKLTMEEVTRFPNQMLQLNGHFYWNIFSLYENIKKGLAAISSKQIPITSVGIDTWGVDFVCINQKGELCGLPYAYRDPHTIGEKENFFKEVLSAKELYKKTGIQHMDFNSIFQLYVMNKNHYPYLKDAKNILFIPDALTYLLTGKISTEYTIASTSSLLNPISRTWDEQLLKYVGVKKEAWGPLIAPGTVVGNITDELKNELQMDDVPVVAVAGHDTASAVAAVPALDSNFAYLSSGTWSLMGIENPNPVMNETTSSNNITNEGGVDGTIRLLKNITGMWIIEQCLKFWEKEDGKRYSYSEIVNMSMQAPAFRFCINPDAPDFVNPKSMPEAIEKYCERTGQEKPANHNEMLRTIYESLAFRYKEVLEMLKKVSDHPIDKLHVIGGGSQNPLISQFTANAVGIPVVCGPAEASSIGNIMMQAKAVGVVNNLQEMRDIIAKNVETKTYMPQDKEDWNNAYKNYITITKKQTNE